MHKGRALREYLLYVHGVADALELPRLDLENAIRAEHNRMYQEQEQS